MQIEINNRTKSKIDLKRVKAVAEKFASVYKISPKKELSIAFVGGQEMKKINRIYRGLDKTTDILSFSGESGDFGELLIDYGQIKKQAAEFKVSVQKELIFILVHGLFHLLGYSDETEAKRLKMIKLGEAFMKKIKL